jgi:hypothetical protein
VENMHLVTLNIVNRVYLLTKSHANGSVIVGGLMQGPSLADSDVSCPWLYANVARRRPKMLNQVLEISIFEPRVFETNNV